MRLISFLCFNSWTSRRARTVSSVLGIALGIGLVVAVLTVDHNSVLRRRNEAMERYGRPDLEIRVPAASRDAFAQHLALVEAWQGVSQATPIALFDWQARAADGTLHPATCLLTRMSTVATFRTVVPRNNAVIPAPKPGTPPVLWMNRHLLGEIGARVGDTVEVRGRSFLIVGLLDGGGQATAERLDLVLVDWAHADLLTPDDPPAMVWAQLNPGTNREAVMAELGDQGMTAQPPPFELLSVTPEDLAMRNGLKICALLSLALGLLVVFHTLLMTVAERRSEIALLHAVGATRRQIGGALMAQAATESVIGAVAGVGLGLLLARGMGAIGASSFGHSAFAIEQAPWPEVFAVAGVGVVITVLGGLYPVLVAGRVPTAQVLYPQGITLPSTQLGRARLLVPFIMAAALLLVFALVRWITDEEAAGLIPMAMRLALLLGLAVSIIFVLPAVIHGVAFAVGAVVPALGGLLYRLSHRNVAASGHRNATAVSGLMLVFVAIFCMHTLTESLKDEIRTWSSLAVQDRLYVQWLGTPPETDPHLFDGLAGVEAVLPIENEVRVPMTVRGFDAAHLLEGDLPERDREALSLLQAGEGAIVTRALASQIGVEENGWLTFETREGQRRVRIALVSDRYGYWRPERAYALLSPSLIDSWFGARSGRAARYLVHHAPDVDPERLAGLLRQRLGQGTAEITTGHWLTQNRLSNIDRDFLVFDVILFGAIAIAGLGLLSALIIRGHERRREIALYRALGMTTGQLSRVFTAEGVVLGLTAGALALVLGAPASYLGFVALKAVSGLDLVYAYPVRWAAICLLLCVGTALLASLYPARRLARENIAAGLKY